MISTKPLIVTADIGLEKTGILRAPMIVKADNVTVEGNGATIRGPGQRRDLETYEGVGIVAEGCSGVTIRNLKIRGFETALWASDGVNWVVEGCDFSDNYHDPEYGWGEGKRSGGLILTSISNSLIRNNRVNRVWNACDLRFCHHSVFSGNDFSHASNTCLKFWNSCHNRIENNNMSFGIRIASGEVHARDSTSLLIESGSDENHFENNDFSHGGDGIFIRVLNDWISTRNTFVENDCSYANNNCVECWAPGNTFIRNRANFGSYGFWMGGSDRSVLIGNEAAYNGLSHGNHNAPEPGFGHGGIVFVNGPSYHVKVIDNCCHHNNGGGIVFRGDLSSRGKRWKAHHWIISGNRLCHNRWGIYAQHADWIFLSGNQRQGNEQQDLFDHVSHVITEKPFSHPQTPTNALISVPPRVRVGEEVLFDGSKSRGTDLNFQWDIGGERKTEPVVHGAFDRPGFYRVGLTVHSGGNADLASADLYVVAPSHEIVTENDQNRWSFRILHHTHDGDQGSPSLQEPRMSFVSDPDVTLMGKSSTHIRVDPYGGHIIEALLALQGASEQDLRDHKLLSFWLRWRNKNVFGFTKTNPTIRLHSTRGSVTLKPENERNLLSAEESYNEVRWGWLYLQVPLQGGDGWVREVVGNPEPHCTESIGFQFVSHGTEPFDIWIDGLSP